LLPRVRAVALLNYAEVARFVGLEPYAMLRRVRIDPELLADPDNWLAARPVADLLNASATESGRGDFAVLLAECRNFASLGPISLALMFQKTLRHVIWRLDEYRRHLNDVVGLDLEESDGVAVVRWTVISEFAHPQIETLIAALGYRALTEAMGGCWLPECAHFSFNRPADSESFQRYFQCGMQFSDSFTGLSFKCDDLDLSNPRSDEAMARHAERLLSLLPSQRESIGDRTRHSLYLLLPDGRATLGAVSRNLGVGVRTLQRALEKEATTFGNLLNETRRDLAKRYLAGGTHTLGEIAELLGYSSSSAFSRWFSGEFGRTPQAWRCALR
jgi:AraC-like DNA-binding protein